MNGTFIEQQENLIFYGGVGTGKTLLASLMGLNAIQKLHLIFRKKNSSNKLKSPLRTTLVCCLLVTAQFFPLFIMHEFEVIHFLVILTPLRAHQRKAYLICSLWLPLNLLQ